MTRSIARARILADRFSRRDILQTGGAALAMTAAAALPRMAQATQSGGTTPVLSLELDPGTLDAFISDAMASYGVPGAAVAVIQGGQPVLSQGYGVRELGSDAPIDADTVFQLASNTKPMTAFTLGTLVDDGLIDWDTPISDLLPELQLWDPYPSAMAHLTRRAGPSLRLPRLRRRPAGANRLRPRRNAPAPSLRPTGRLVPGCRGILQPWLLHRWRSHHQAHRIAVGRLNASAAVRPGGCRC